jgi:Type I phosphodiesterase / nucleotide pyrophosphatase
MRCILTLLLIMMAVSIRAQMGRKTENVIIVTLDGMRWQEVFGGADEVLLNTPEYTHGQEELKKKFWHASSAERRKRLFPFLWTTVAAHGQIYGNRALGSHLNNANPYWFSYPGYNELLTGYPDTAVNSNDKIPNPNENVLEFINKQKGYQGKVAAFTTWDVFPYILNAQRSGVYVNADVDTIKLKAAGLQLINDMQFLTTRPIGVRPDIFTYMAGREYLKAYQPKLLYIAFDETDDFAHNGMYDQYLGSAYAEDAMIADIWKTVQSMPGYKDKTTLIVTCDHGRGDKVKATWKDHGSKVEGANELWLAVIGPDTKHLGELASAGQLYQQQIAATVAQLLGFNFTANHPVAAPIQSIYQP